MHAFDGIVGRRWLGKVEFVNELAWGALEIAGGSGYLELRRHLWARCALFGEVRCLGVKFDTGQQKP